MYELNGIVYADDQTPLLTVKSVRPLADYKLSVRFSTGEEKRVVWNNGTIDIAPEYLYENSMN